MASATDRPSASPTLSGTAPALRAKRQSLGSPSLLRLIGCKPAVEAADAASSDYADAVVLADRPRGFRYGVDADAGIERPRDVDPVVLGESLEDLGIPRKVLLFDARHAAARIWQGDGELHFVADRDRATDPLVLDEAMLGVIDDHVHTEPPDVEVGVWFEFAQPVETRCREHAHRVQVEEGVFGDGRGEPPLVEEGCAELRLDDLVPVSVGIVVLLIRVVLIDRVAVVCGGR